MKGYKKEMKEFIKSLSTVLTPAEKREALEGWKKGYWAAQESHKDRPYEGKEGVNISTGDFSERVKPTSKSRVKPKITPFEADPDYRDPKEREHAEADLHGVKQQRVTIEDVTIFELPAFKIKSARLRRAVEVLELKLGYDHKTNKQVLYSPLAYNKRWDQQSQVIWLRVIGMSPKRIGLKLKIKYDTIKNWLRVLKDQPLVATTQYDWAIRQIEGRGEYSTKFSSVEAKPRSVEVIR